MKYTRRPEAASVVGEEAGRKTTTDAGKTKARVTRLALPTYPEADYERLPIFADNRVHQRTTGRVYPNTIVNGVVRSVREEKEHTAIVLENDFIELIVLPDFGGRIFSARDKTNGYHFFYRQHVLKPALIGLLGSWVSGGAEFNWPLHHRPSTFMPVDFEIEESPDGSATVWLSEHEPLDRMKGMIGIHLHPEHARFETRVRLFNRTALPRSFLFWQNIAVPVNEQYQIFFPPDVRYVHFHYKKSVTGYPIADGMFNGIDFGAGVDIRWHRNVKNATSFFSAPSRHDFFGGYDHGLKAGVVHVADHHVSPGKKLFTWGYNQLSRTWEKALTDNDGQYAELMSGSYSDNQPDFAWLEPLETKAFEQCWYPIKAIGEPRAANKRVAVALGCEGGRLEARVFATEPLPETQLCVRCGGTVLLERQLELRPAVAVSVDTAIGGKVEMGAVAFTLKNARGEVLLEYDPALDGNAARPQPMPVVASPERLATAEERYRAGLHVDQYRDPLVSGEAYWRKVLEQEPCHVESLKGLGRHALQQGRFDEAVRRLSEAITVLTRFNPNPRDGEAYYMLGLAQRGLENNDAAEAAFAKACWNFAWRSAAGYGLAQVDCVKGKFADARRHLEEVVSVCGQNSKARTLLAAVLRLSGETARAVNQIEAVLREDPLDHWARHERALLAGAEKGMLRGIFDEWRSDPAQTCLDVAFEYADAGLWREALELLEAFSAWGASKGRVSAMIHYTGAWLAAKLGDGERSKTELALANTLETGRCFPFRNQELTVLRWVRSTTPGNARAADLLAGWLHAKGRRDEALELWEGAVNSQKGDYRLWRNLAVGYYSCRHDRRRAAECLEKARSLAPDNPQLLWELEYVEDRLGTRPEERHNLLSVVGKRIPARDDLILARAKTQNGMRDHRGALETLLSHAFVACEGGEHAIVEQFQYAHLALGRKALASGMAEDALAHFRAAQVVPESLGAGFWNVVMTVQPAYFEALALRALGKTTEAEDVLRRIVEMHTDDFSTMYLPALPCFVGRAQILLGAEREGRKCLEGVVAFTESEMSRSDVGPFRVTPFFISYQEDPRVERLRHFGYLAALASSTLGDVQDAKRRLREVLALFSNDLWPTLELRALENDWADEIRTETNH